GFTLGYFRPLLRSGSGCGRGRPHDSRPGGRRYNIRRGDQRSIYRLLNAEVGKDFGFSFLDGEQVVADGTVLRNSVATLRGVVAVMATEASRIVHVANVVGMRSPGH